MRFINKTLTGEVVLDGNIFINCRLHNATIIYSGKKFAFEQLRITGNSRFSLKGPAATTMDFLTLLAHSNRKQFRSCSTAPQTRCAIQARTIDADRRLAAQDSLLKMMVPLAANMPPTPWAMEILAPGTCAAAVPRNWRTLSWSAYMPYIPECM